MELLFTGSSKMLYRGCRYVYPGEIVEMSEEEFKMRDMKQPGVWKDKTQKVDRDKEATMLKAAKVKTKTPLKRVGQKLQK